MTPPAEASFLALDLKSVTADGAFEGYASLFNREDLGLLAESSGCLSGRMMA